jgi:RND superfamily putative drug exporter
MVTVGTVAVLLACASGLARTEVGNTLIRGLPADSDTRIAYEAATRGFTSGIVSPTVLIVEGPGITARRQDLRALQRRIEAQPGVVQVVGPRQQPLERNLGAVYSRSRDAVRYLVVFDADPLGARAIGLLGRLRARLPALLRASDLAGARVSVAGDTALSEETVRRVEDDLGRISIAVLLVVLVILSVFLRALVAPLLSRPASSRSPPRSGSRPTCSRTSWATAS